jgi:acetolactate synthase-1/2/3 large subunit
VIRALRGLLPPGSVVTTDAGNFAGWAARYLPVPDGGRFLGPTSGAMGYGLPAAIGAAIARRETPDPDRVGGAGDQAGEPRAGRVPPVVALAGDGGFAMLMAEIETAVREGLRLVAIVIDNAMYGTIRMHQELRHPGRAVATDLGAIDFARVAAACGARAATVARDADVEPALAAALRQPGVSVVHVLADPRYLSVDRMLPG